VQVIATLKERAATLCFDRMATRGEPALDTTSRSYAPFVGSEQPIAPATSPA
jgi:hypothetical protein